MPEGYLITKPDGTRHAVLKTNAMTEFLQMHNSICQDHERIKYVSMDEQKAESIIHTEGVMDNSYSPVPKVGVLQNVVKSQQQEIENLKAQLLEAQQVPTSDIEDSTKEELTVVKTLEKLNSLTTIEEIQELLVGEERGTVINAANKLIKKLS